MVGYTKVQECETQGHEATAGGGGGWDGCASDLEFPIEASMNRSFPRASGPSPPSLFPLMRKS